jgi:hypothetical protein
MDWGKRFKGYAGGIVMLLLGIGTMVQGQTYSIGSLSRMGPGYFPVALGAILSFIGVMLLIAARVAEPQEKSRKLPPQWRGWICIVLGVAAFPIIGRYGGFVPATFAIVFISALGERDNTLRGITLLSLVMVAFCVLVFWWGLNIQFPLFGWGNS